MESIIYRKSFENALNANQNVILKTEFYNYFEDSLEVLLFLAGKKEVVLVPFQEFKQLKKFESNGGDKNKIKMIKTSGSSIDDIQKSIISESSSGKVVLILSPHKLTELIGFAAIKKFILDLKKELGGKGVSLVFLLSTSTSLPLIEIMTKNMDQIIPIRKVSIVKEK